MAEYWFFQGIIDYWTPDYPWTWEAIEVTTSDNYILTLFHMYNEETVDESLGPILFQHGGYMDGATYYYGAYHQMTQMADLGHHIYLGNNRGT